MSVLRFLHSQLFVRPPQHISDFTDQVVVVTGGNAGLGWEAARQLVTLGAAQVIITVRSHEKGRRALHDLRAATGKQDQIQYELLDMGSYQSVLDFSERLSALQRLDAIILNAGFARTEFAILEDNESMITVNVLSTMLLAARMVPILRTSANKFGALGRICVITSDTHEWTTIETERKSDSIFDALSDIESAKMHERYFVSKLLEIFAVRAMAEHLVAYPKYQAVAICAVNPGLCHSSLTNDIGGLEQRKYDLMKVLLARSTEQGAKTYLHALSVGYHIHGKYLSDYEINDDQLSPFVRSLEGVKTQARVWDELCERLNKIAPGTTEALTPEE